MKILAIRGKNLASLEGDFEINFECEPLLSAGIFAITGSTGSGKTTLLDTMCIALFATSPRINKVYNNSDIIDVSNHILKEDDCRNILRKGCKDGYAEVDFKALNGEKFRARWSVRRAHDKIDGKLQSPEHTLYNITRNSIVDGGKKEKLTTISNLIGLTYEQFTRAVLLAQGEFATFLKAPAKEKAEILEKLTGTEIYSKISARIYEKNKQATAELKLIEEKIKDIHLQTDEEKQELEISKNNISHELDAIEKNWRVLEGKRAWIERATMLQKNILQAEDSLKAAQKALDSYRKEIDFLAQIESVQEIRDTYTAILSIKSRKSEAEKALKQENASLQTLDKELCEANKKVEASQKELETINAKWQAAQPRLKEALKTETECHNLEKQRKELSSEIEEKRKEVQENTNTLNSLTNEATQKEEELRNIAKWFKEHEEYKNIIPKVDIAIANIKDIKTSEQQIDTREKLLSEALSILQSDEKRLKANEAEIERLNKILPAEIATLRASLIEGEPCPVCGSRHHETYKIEIDTLKEADLQNAKKSVQEAIAHITASIEQTKNSVTTNKAYIDSLRANLAECKRRLEDIMQPLQKRYEINDEFAKQLQETARLWNANTQRENESGKTASVNREKISILKEKEQSILKEIENREKNVSDIVAEITTRRKKILELTAGHSSVEEVENQFAKEIQRTNQNATHSIEHRNGIIVAREKSLARAAQTQKSIQELSVQFENAKKEIEAFLEHRTDELSLEGLHKLITADSREVAAARQKREELRNALLTSTATLKERQEAFEEHKKQSSRPTNEEDLQSISQTIETLGMKKKLLFEQLSEINSRQKLNDENTKIFCQHKEDFEKKSTQCNRWKILNDAFGSAEGDKFKIMAQGYTLDILLEYANKHLKDISQRYRLARTNSESLTIKIIDLDMLSEERSVHSLSGGETFLVSLALALALSSVSSNKMSIESLFIDEGFGSLDNETLRTAMEALERLQSQGRKVGVISHLQEMIERIPVKIRVIKESSGKSRISIEGY